MSTQSQRKEEHITDQVVADYLRNNPDFFAQHLDLLAELRVPHVSGSAVSLIERQVSLIRDQLERQKARFSEIVQVGEDNHMLTERMHTLTLALMETKSEKDVVDVLHEKLRSEFGVDAISIHLREVPEESMPEGLVEALEKDDPIVAAYENSFREQKPICGKLDESQIAHVFAGIQNGVKSAAVLPLSNENITGYIGLGSFKSDHFHGAKDTTFLRYLAGIASHAFKKAKA